MNPGKRSIPLEPLQVMLLDVWKSVLGVALAITSASIVQVLTIFYTLLTVTMICQCGTGAISALNVFFVTRDLHASSGLFGIAETAMGIGFIIGALAAGRMVRWIGARALTWSGLLATGVLAAGYALQRSFPAGLVMLAIYAIPIAMLNTAVAPLLLDAAPREYMGRVMAVFMPVNQLASMVSVVISGWLTSTVLRSFRASFAGITLNSVSLIFIVAGGLIFASGIRAFAAPPRELGRGAHAARSRPEVPRGPYAAPEQLRRVQAGDGRDQAAAGRGCYLGDGLVARIQQGQHTRSAGQHRG